MRDLPERRPAITHSSRQGWRGAARSPAILAKVVLSLRSSGNAKAARNVVNQVDQLSAGLNAAPSRLLSSRAWSIAIMTVARNVRGGGAMPAEYRLPNKSRSAAGLPWFDKTSG